MFEKFFCDRLVELRLKKGVSARDMSLSIGQSESYINRIENHKMLPSLSMFFYICEYFKITPQEFFVAEKSKKSDSMQLLNDIEKLPTNLQVHIAAIIEALNNTDI